MLPKRSTNSAVGFSGAQKDLRGAEVLFSSVRPFSSAKSSRVQDLSSLLSFSDETISVRDRGTVYRSASNWEQGKKRNELDSASLFSGHRHVMKATESVSFSRSKSAQFAHRPSSRDTVSVSRLLTSTGWSHQRHSFSAPSSPVLSRQKQLSKSSSFSSAKPLNFLKKSIAEGGFSNKGTAGAQYLPKISTPPVSPELRRKLEKSDKVTRSAQVLINEHRQRNSLHKLRMSSSAETKSLAEALEEAKDCRYLRVVKRE